MLHLITGTPGSGKTLYAVFLIDKQENINKTAIEYNAKVYESNLEIIKKNDLQYEFLSVTYFSKVIKDYETVIFDENHFDFIKQKERTENIFLDITFYNLLVDKIRKDHDVELKTLKVVRHIYQNIDGLKVDNIRPIEVDWRKCPDGSVIFYDEIQLIDEYSNDNKKDTDGIIKYLTVHRHRAFDIYGITQFPRLVNVGFRDVVGLHYHLHRGWGAPSATVYVWANCREKPNSLGNKLTAERDFRFNYPKRLYQVYESATANTVKLRVPLKLFAILLIPLFGLILFGSMLSSGKDNFLVRIFGGDKKEEVKTPTSTTNQPTSKPTDQATVQPISNKVDECRKAENVDKPECKKWFDDLTKNNQSVSSTGEVYKSVSYNPNKPFSVDEIEYQYQVTSTPIFSGCIKFDGRYYAYTQQGTRLKVSQDDCKKIMNGDRPFNPFQQPQQQVNQNVQVNNQSVDSGNSQRSATQMAQLDQLQSEQRPHNTVQPHLMNDQRFANKGGGLANFS